MTAVVVLIASTGLIMFLVLRGSQDNPGATAPEAAPTTSVTPRPQTPDELVAKWEPKLQGVSEPCVQDTISPECTTAAVKLGELARDLAADADALNLVDLANEARRIEGETTEWQTVCLATAAEGHRWPNRCGVEIYSTVRLGDRTLIGRLHEAAQSL